MRIFHFIFFLLIVLLTYKTFNNKFYLYLLIFIYLISDILFVYSFILRSYYISSFLFCIIFFLISKNFNNQKLINLNLIFFICALLLINNVSSLFLVLPIIFTIFFNFKFFSFREKISKFIISFLIFFILVSSIQFFLTGLYMENIPNIYEKVFSDDKAKLLKFLSLIKEKFIYLYFSGIKTIYFNNYTESTLSFNLINFLIQIKNNFAIFFIFLISLLILIFNIIKNKVNIFDYIIFYFFCLFVLLNKFPPERVYAGFIYFFIFYIFFYFKNIKSDFTILKYSILILSFIIVLFEKNVYRELGPLKVDNLKEKQIKIENNLECNLKQFNFDEIEKHLFYYLYLEKCNKKRSFIDYKNFFNLKKNP